MVSLLRLKIVTLVVAGMFAAALLSYGDTQTSVPNPSANALEVKCMTVRPGEISRTLEVTGSIIPFRMVQLASPAEGPVVSLRVREGDRVRKNDTVLVIGRREGTEAQIASLAESVRKEEANLVRVERLLAIDGNSKEQADQAKAAYETAKAQLVKAQEAARDFAIVAPWPGITSRLFVEEGDYNYISPRKPLLEMYDPSSLVLRLSVPEHYATQVKEGTPVEVTLDAYPDTVFTAAISRIYPFLDERMRTRTVEVTISGSAKLLPGMFARTKLKTGAITDALVVPAQAIVTTPGASVVYVVTNGKAQRRVVRTGLEDAGRVQIVEGLKPGDSVVVTGVMGLGDGRLVRVKDGPINSTAIRDTTRQTNTKTPDGRP